MPPKPGISSSRGPAPAPTDHATNALVVFGILVSCVFIGGSALLNYRMGFTSAGNATDGSIYGSLAAAGDGLKALSPFVAAYGWRHRDWLAMTAATIIFVIFTAYSFTSALGFSSQHRAAKEETAATLMERHRDARDTVDRDRRKLDALGPQRPSAEISQQISNQLRSPVGSGRWTVDEVSESCTKNKPLTRAACEKLAILKEELARAQSSEALTVELTSFTGQLKTADAPTTADAQADALTFLGRLLHLMPAKATKDDGNTASQGLALLMAIFIELGSGLGLYIATTPWRAQVKAAPEPAASPPLPALENAPPLEAFAGECLERRGGQQVNLAVAFEAYKEWCERRNRPMQGRSRFERGVLKLAKELGLGVDSTRAGWVIRDVALRRSLPGARRG